MSIAVKKELLESMDAPSPAVAGILAASVPPCTAARPFEGDTMQTCATGGGSFPDSQTQTQPGA